MVEENPNNISNEQLIDELASRGRITFNHNVYINNLNTYESGGGGFNQPRLGNTIVNSAIRVLANPLARKLVATSIGAGVAYVSRKKSPHLIRRAAEKLKVSSQTMEIIDSMLPSEKEPRLSIKDLNEITYNNNGYFVLSNKEAKLNNTPLTDYLREIYGELNFSLQHKIAVKTAFTNHYLKFLKREDIAILYTEKWDLGKLNEGSVTYLLRRGENKTELLIDIYKINITNTNSAIEKPKDEYNITEVDLSDCIDLLKTYDKGFFEDKNRVVKTDKFQNISEADFEIVE